jgi:hypothetical protein
VEQEQQQQDPFDVSYNNYQASSNRDFNNASALQIRLDTRPLIEDIELFLRGVRYEYSVDPVTRNEVRSMAKIGKPKANPLGIQSILYLITSLVNSQNVQGNFKEPQYFDFVYWARLDISKSIMYNMGRWEILEEDFDFIVNQVMNMVEPFMSRLIGNEERKSYAETIRHSETNTLQNQKGFPFGLFGGNKQNG